MIKSLSSNAGLAEGELLLPCPCCGISATAMRNKTRWWIECDACGLNTPTDNFGDPIKIWNSRYTSPASEVETEQGRWQDAIRDHVVKICGIPNADVWVDGAGCDSGDPLDVSLAEISQVVNRLIDDLDALHTGEAELKAEVGRLKAELDTYKGDPND